MEIGVTLWIPTVTGTESWVMLPKLAVWSKPLNTAGMNGIGRHTLSL
jgi:hypothetical protein